MKDNLKIIAGPCSVDEKNYQQIREILQIKVNGKRAVWGVRVVGLKSRTNFEDSKEAMGLDYPAAKKNLRLLHDKKDFDKMVVYPSVTIAKRLIEEFDTVVATEVMFPHLQLPVFEKYLPKNRVFLWNPAVNQLGWPLWEMAYFAQKNHWYLGIKNPKWLGEEGKSFAKTWVGLHSYATSFLKERERIVLIHRGVDVENKGHFRNLPVHQVVKKIKKENPEIEIFFDPSHTYGPKLKDKIIEGTLEAMRLKVDGEFLYHGILIEVGDSKTDTYQHLTVAEFKDLVDQLSKFRKLNEN